MIWLIVSRDRGAHINSVRAFELNNCVFRASLRSSDMFSCGLGGVEFLIEAGL